MPHDALLGWFDAHAFPFLQSHAPDRAAALFSDAVRLRALNDDPREFVVCFLGNAGVGKSTLLNALVAGVRTVVPAGGIGPLTAMATTVRFSDQAAFTARYHEPKMLWQVVSTLMLAHENARKKSADASFDSRAALSGDALSGDASSDVFGFDNGDMSRDEATEIVGNAAATLLEALPEAPSGGADQERPGTATRYESILKQAKQLVTGDQFSQAEIPYLVDCLRLALGREVMYGSSPSDGDASNIARIKAALTHAAEGRQYHRESDRTGEFGEDLRRHAAGHLAPLIREVEVGWPSQLLRSGLVLVDLPGVGVANDAYRAITQQYVRERARAVVIVANRAGITEAVLDLIRTSGYWDRLVGAAYEPDADPCALLVAVSQMDDVADEEWQNYKDLEKEVRPTKRRLFAEQTALMITRCRAQAAEQLGRINRVSDSAAVNEARSSAASQLREMLEIHPVSAPEYRRIQADDDDDRPRMLRDEEESGVPRLAQSLQALASDAAARTASALQTVHDRLARGIRDELTIIESQWRAEDRAAGEAERLRRELDEFLVPIRQQLANRQGSFREFLQETVQSKINELVLEARDVAERDVRAYLSGLRHCHWMTLRAAVQRGGTFAGAHHIDLPADISDYFQEPMAGVWGVKLLRDVRKRTKEYADDCVFYVDEVCDWARGQGARVKADLVDVQQHRVRGQASQLHQVGKEASDELRAVVRSELQRVVTPAIRKKCEEFVQRGDSVGRGVKQRILELFDQLSLDATRAAEQPARRILQKRFVEVREQIDQSFREWGDPLQDTVDAIASSHAQRVRRSDAQRRGRILADLEAVQAAMPPQLHGVPSLPASAPAEAVGA
jgi:GTP-binding protein EngB required for normal cell division